MAISSKIVFTTAPLTRPLCSFYPAALTTFGGHVLQGGVNNVLRAFRKANYDYLQNADPGIQDTLVESEMPNNPDMIIVHKK